MAVKSSFKNMTICLTAICLVCSALLACVYVLTKEPIEIAKANKNEMAIKEVLPETVAIIGPEQTINVDKVTYKYNFAMDKDSVVVGCAINVSKVGFGGPIEIKVGFDVLQRVIHNTKVLSQSETPGLGAKCADPKEKFVTQFKGFDPFKNELKVKKDGGQLDAITASTITSRAYADALAIAVKVFEQLCPAQSDSVVTSDTQKPATDVAQDLVAEDTLEKAAEGDTASEPTSNKEE